MADMNLEVAAQQLTGIQKFADEAVAAGTVPADCRDLFIAEIFRSALRLSEAEAMVELQRSLRDSDMNQALGRALSGGLVKPH